MKINIYHTVRTTPKPNQKHRCKTGPVALAQYIHGYSLSWLGTGISINSDWVQLVLWNLASTIIERMLSVMDVFSRCE
jgi:hypothetical protein